MNTTLFVGVDVFQPRSQTPMLLVLGVFSQEVLLDHTSQKFMSAGINADRCGIKSGHENEM